MLIEFDFIIYVAGKHRLKIQQEQVFWHENCKLLNTSLETLTKVTMKTICYSFLRSILFVTVLTITSCNKDYFPNPPDPGKEAFELPFENSNLKMELISSSIPGSSRVTDIHFFNESTGVLITYDGKIIKTSNRGVTWSIQYSNASNAAPLNQILFIDDKVGYVVGGDENSYSDHTSGGMILKTSDGGDTWTNVFQVTGSIKCNSIAKNNENTLFVIGNANTHKSDKIFKSMDGGITWITSDYKDFKLSKIAFADKYGYCTGGAYPGTGKIYKSVNNGDSWIEAKSFTNTDWTWDLAFKDSIGFCIGNNQSIYKTDDFGASWTLVHSGSSYKINLLTYNSCLIWGGGGWSGGDFGYETGSIRQTTNGGKDWIDYRFKKDIGGLRCSSFYTETDGYVVAGKYLIKVTVK